MLCNVDVGRMIMLACSLMALHVTEAQTVSVELHDIQSGQTEKYYCDG